MAYSRFFMPLVQEAKGYEFNGRQPAGRCIVEVRDGVGKLSVWVQDLKIETRYSLFLVFADKGQHVGFDMGTLAVDTKGKAEVKRDITNIHTFNIAEVTAVAVVATGAGNVTSPLCGYRDAQVSWRHSFRVWKQEEVRVQVPTPVPVPVAEEPKTIEEPLVPVVEETSVVEELPPPVAEAEPVVEEPPIPVIEVVEAPPPPPALTPPQATRPQHNIQIETTHTNTQQLLEAIFSVNTPCEPFTNQDHHVKWVQCDRLEQMPLPPDCLHHNSEPFMLRAWADHEHFLLGITEAGNQYIIGVAGTYSAEDKIHAKRLGFTQFKPLKKERPRTGDEGYWLMFVGL